MVTFVTHWMRWYKKPSYVDLKALAASFNKSSEEGVPTWGVSSRTSISSSKSEVSIPKALSLERVLDNRTCSPMSLYDFYMYLKHIEHSQENLEFYMWYRDYEKRCEDSIKKAKSWSEMASERDVLIHNVENEMAASIDADFELPQPESLAASQAASKFMTYIESVILYRAARYPKPCCTAFLSAPTGGDGASSGVCPVTFATGPEQRREELRQIVALFLTEGADKELNIPPSMRKAVVTSVAHSDAPEFLAPIADHVYHLLRHGSHRNFVRLGVNNGTFETLCMVTFVGIVANVAGFLTMLLIAFASPDIHRSSRWRGLAAVPLWFVGLTFLLAGMRGSCFLLLMFSRRQELPWERVEVDEKTSVHTARSGNVVVRFARKMMIFERKIRVKDVGLRRLQRKIVVQSVAGAALGTAVLEVFFLCLPIWR